MALAKSALLPAKSGDRALATSRTINLEGIPNGELDNLDPYLIWASFVRNQTLLGPAPNHPPLLSAFIELKRMTSKLGNIRIGEDGHKFEPTRKYPEGDVESRFAAGFITYPQGVDVDGEHKQLPLKALVDHDEIKRLIVSAPRGDPHSSWPAGKQTGLRYGVAAIRRMARTASASVASVLRSRPGKAGWIPEPRPILLGIVDDVCSFASHRLCKYDDDGVAPRLRALWHQGLSPHADDKPKSGPHADKSNAMQLFWRNPRGFFVDRFPLPKKWWTPANEPLGPGRRRTLRFELGGELNLDYLRTYLKSGSSNEWLAMWDSGYSRRPPRWTHGCVVTDLAVGHHEGPRLCHDDDGRAYIGWPRAMAKPEPDYVFVQLPGTLVADTSGASLAAHVYDAILYIVDQARDGENVVVNLSYGSYGGPHDGSSLFERAMCDLLDRFGGSDSRGNPRDSHNRVLHIVLPAGNSHMARGHFSAFLSAQQREVTMYWRVLPDDATDSFVEIWFERGLDVVVSVQPPGTGYEPILAERGEAWGWNEELPGNEFIRTGAVIHPKTVPNAEGGSMVLVALAKTRNAIPDEPKDGDEPKPKDEVITRAPPGIWAITVCARGELNDRVAVHAWIQRDDSPPGMPPVRGRPTERQSSFVDLPGCRAEVAPESTLNGIATAVHDRLFVVGAMRGDDGSLSRYSSAGPCRHPHIGRFEGVEAVAVADESTNVPGELAAGVSAGSRVRVSGTSIAAARFSRALGRHLSTGRSAASFVWPTPEKPSRQRIVAEGEPRPAHDVLRGEYKRMPLGRSADD